MAETKYMMVDGINVPIEGEKNLLELIRKAGIAMPTFCYHSSLSIHGACRMCLVETERGGLEAACTAEPKAGIKVFTNTPRLRKYRKMILELLLANHCRDCTTCQKSGDCQLQALAKRFDIKGVQFPNMATEPRIDNSSPSITRDKSKCILCGDCVRMCNEVQEVGAIDFAHRGSNMAVSTVFDVSMEESNCVRCGQCAAVCPTGAIVVKNDVDRMWASIADRDCRVVVQIAPAVRVALGKALGLPEDKDYMGLLVAALRRMGFDEIFDTSTAADLTVLEEANEFVGRLQKGENLPLFTSCCPAWVTYCEKNHPELMKNVSSCRSPMQMFASVLREHYKNANCKDKIFHVAIMPCTAKKFEAARKEFNVAGHPNVDCVLTTQEAVRMIREAGIVFSELEPEAVDMPFGIMSGAGVIFGVTGGVTEAVVRYVSPDKSNAAMNAIAYTGIRGLEGCKEATIKVGDNEISIAVVSGLGNAKEIIRRVKSGEKQYHIIEVMACPGGCIYRGGQPAIESRIRKQRYKALYASDKMNSIKRSEANPIMQELYDGILKGRTHELLHVHYETAGKGSH